MRKTRWSVPDQVELPVLWNAIRSGLSPAARFSSFNVVVSVLEELRSKRAIKLGSGSNARTLPDCPTISKRKSFLFRH